MGRGAAAFLRQRRTRIDELSRQGTFGPVPTGSSSRALDDFAISFGLPTACSRYYSMNAAISCGGWLRRLDAAVDGAIECSEVGVKRVAAAESGTGAPLGRGSHERAQASRQHFPGQRQRHASKGAIERTDSVLAAIGMPTQSHRRAGAALLRTIARKPAARTDGRDRRWDWAKRTPFLFCAR